MHSSYNKTYNCVFGYIKITSYFLHSVFYVTNRQCCPSSALCHNDRLSFSFLFPHHHPLRPLSSVIARQKTSNTFPVVCNGSPSRIRNVRRISLGMTTLPSSSILRTIPVARKLSILLDGIAVLDERISTFPTTAYRFFFASLLWDYQPRLSLENLPFSVLSVFYRLCDGHSLFQTKGRLNRQPFAICALSNP